ncbi:SPRY domain-containing protein 3-like [Antedon mediterranea]|uniref:SPRY domain-containing protein 3-like n=1 Tax=Antedon mediterranea TaxID=105859 RepID=UPI003AF57D89
MRRARRGIHFGLQYQHFSRVRMLGRFMDREANRPRYYGVLRVENTLLSKGEGLFVDGMPVSPGNSFFEVELSNPLKIPSICVGLSPPDQKPGTPLGSDEKSLGYNVTDSSVHHKGEATPYDACKKGDKIGCGVKFSEDAKDDEPRTVYFTINGREIATQEVEFPACGLFPAISFKTAGDRVQVHLQADGPSMVEEMVVDSCEEDWARLHDVDVNGPFLSYVGRGKSTANVGLAQARKPVTPTNHYFELEIIDPGKNCYVAIGLARRNYPKSRHPGWNYGSIAYHADDGKLFNGVGQGDPFGPRCYKGDIMGCGVMFPRDYQFDDEDKDAEEEEGASSVLPARDPLYGLGDLNLMYPRGQYEDDDQDLINEELMDLQSQGISVQVFFTRNGKTIGRREVRIPQGGFFPSIGMMSIGEKVRIDLRPLSG